MSLQIARAAWDLDVRARRAAPAAALAMSALVAANAVVPSVSPRAPRAAPEAPRERWRAWREHLHAAHAQRRSGDDAGAIRSYERVGRASRARVRDADLARYWSARLRLERGERSASIALRALLTPHVDPALAYRIGACIARARSDARSEERRAELTSIAREVRGRLRALSVVRTEEGARARRWFAAFERSIAPDFFR